VDQRKRRQARYVAASVEKTLGALPVVADYCRRLDLAGIIDHAAPIRELADLTHGQVIETLIANRLTSPAPLVRVSDWAREWAVADVFGIDPGILNDDRIGRALDAIAPELDHLVGSVGAQAISAFGIDVSRLHGDMTSVSLYGAYDQTEDDYPANSRTIPGASQTTSMTTGQYACRGPAVGVHNPGALALTSRGALGSCGAGSATRPSMTPTRQPSCFQTSPPAGSHRKARASPRSRMAMASDHPSGHIRAPVSNSNTPSTCIGRKYHPVPRNAMSRMSCG
jgi:hypothetical protein